MIAGLLQYRAKVHKNPELLKYLEECQTTFSKNPHCKKTTFISNNFVQRALDKICDYIIKSVVTIIKTENKGRFSLMTDTTTDISSKNICSVVLRYADDALEINNTTVGFVHIKDSTGQGIYRDTRSILDKIGLNIQNIIATSLDGASNMSSTQQGLVGFIKEISGNYLNFWCYSHRINLIIKGACDKYFSLLFQNVNGIANMYHKSYKRSQEWRRILKLLKSLYKNINELIRPVRLCPTRWWVKHKSLHNIVKNETHFLAIYIFLFNIVHSKKFKAKPQIQLKKKILFNFFQKEETVVILFVLHSILSKLQGVTNFLQSSNLKIFEVLPKIQQVYEYIHNLVNNENALQTLIKEAKIFFKKVLKEISVKKTNDLLSKSKKNIETIQFSTLDKEMEENILNTFKSFSRDLLLNLQLKFIDNDLKENKSFYKEVMYFSPKSLNNRIDYNTISLSNISVYTGIEEHTILNQLKSVASNFKQFVEKGLRNNLRSSVCNNDNASNVSVDTALSNSIDSLSLYDNSNAFYELNDESNTTDPKKNKEQHVTEWKLLKEFITTENNKNQYKELLDVYKYILSIPLTQNKCESDFSKLKTTKNSSRSIMGDKMLQNIMLINLGRSYVPDNAHPEIINMIGISSRKLITQLIHKF